MFMQQKNILIGDEQEEFIQGQSRFFNLSKFVRSKLAEYIKMKEFDKSLEEQDD